MLYKTCGAGAIRVGNGFEEKRGTAFSVVENGVVSNHGFFLPNVWVFFFHKSTEASSSAKHYNVRSIF